MLTIASLRLPLTVFLGGGPKALECQRIILLKGADPSLSDSYFYDSLDFALVCESVVSIYTLFEALLLTLLVRYT